MRPWSERDWVRWASGPGAAWALLRSVRKPDLLKALIAFYGTGLWLQSEYSVARAAYPGHYAEVDEWEPVEEVRGTQEALRAAGHEVTFYTYPSVGHWFFEEDVRPTTRELLASLGSAPWASCKPASAQPSVRAPQQSVPHPPELTGLFTRVRGRCILRTSHLVPHR
jgi:dienelactone hydrolase